MLNRRTAALFLLALAVVPSFVFAAPGVPRMLNYQGRLLSSGGTLLGGTGTEYCFKFSLYDTQTVGAGTKLWPTSAPSTMTATVKNGVFTLGIGDTNIGGDVLDFNFQDTDTAYLNVEVAAKVGATCAPGDGAESFETLSPRQRILASGYAINASMVGGFSASQYASGNQIPVLSTGNLILGGTNPFINATTTNTLTLQGGGEATGDIQFFSSANKITAQGNLTLAGGVTASAGTTTNATSTTLFSAIGRFTSVIADALVAAVATITNLTATNFTATHATTTNATSTSLFAAALSSLSGLFGDITATSSADLASTTAQGRLITGNIVATSTATSSFAGPVRVGLNTSPYKFSILGSTTAATSATGTAVLAVSNSNPTLSSGTNVLRLNLRTAFGTTCTSASTCPRFIEYFSGVGDDADTGGRGVGSLRLSTAGTGITQTSGAADFAEYMVLNSAASVGDLVSLNANGEYQRAVAGQSLIGVVSDNPAFVGNANLEGEPNAYVVGFAGVIETTVSDAHGAIGAGDFIAASTTAGVGVKLVGSGFTLGQALEAWSGPGTGQISVLVFPKYIDAAVVLDNYGGVQGGISGYWDFSTTTGMITLASSSYALALTNKLTLGNASATAMSSTYASSTQGFFGSLSVGNLSGILRATGGAIASSLVNLASDVTGFLGVTNGGTGTSTAPSAGQLLVGNAIGGYDLVATSSLGITGTFSTTSASFFAAQGLAFSTTSSDYWKSINDFFSTTSADYYVSQANLSGFSTTSADYWKTARDFFSTTSASYFLAQNQGAAFSTTSADYWETQQTARSADDLTNNSIEDLNDVTAMTENYGDLFAWNGSTWTDFATSTLGIALADTTGTLAANRGGTGLSSITAAGILLGNYSGTGWQQLSTSTLGLLSTHVAEGSNLYYQDSRVQTYLDTITKGYFFGTTSAQYFLAQNQGAAFSTTSAAFFSAQGLAFSTTSSDYWKSVNNFFSTTSAQYFAAATDLFSTSSANYFVASSSTVPKTYEANTFTALQTFGGASSTNLTVSNLASTSKLVASNSFTLGTVTGFLKATAGVVASAFVDLATDVTGFLGVSNGGTGTSTAPTYGQVLVGNALGGYDLIATSSLGISSSSVFGYLFPGNATGTLIAFNGGIIANASSTIGNGTQSGGLTVSGGATTTGNLVVQGSGTSTFAHGVDIASGCFAVNGECIGGAGGGGGGGSGVLVAIQTFSTPGVATYVPSPGATVAHAIVTGAGGGGGGADAPTADTANETSGGGGGAGGTAIVVVDVVATTSVQVTVGTGGTAGANTGGNAGTGGGSRFSTFAIVNGGVGGNGSAVNAACGNGSSGTPGTGGAATAGDVLLTGSPGGEGQCAAEDVIGGNGGASYWGGGGRGAADPNGNLGSAGSAGTTYGSGGGGASNEDTDVGAAGGAGAHGVVVVYEYGPFTGELGVTSGGTGTTTAPTYGQLLVGDGLGGYNLLATSSLGILGSFSTTSSDYWKSVNDFFSTTSAAHFSSLGLAFSTTSTQYYVSTTDLFSTTSANYFAHSSTTLAKTYTANTFTALQTFGNASTTNISATYASSTQGFFGSLSIGNLTGILRATAGAITSTLIDLASDVTGIVQVANGGTGWGNITAGTLLTGNGTGALATTTVGASLQLSGGTLALNTGNTNAWTGLQSFTLASSTVFSAGRAYFGQTATTTIDTAGNVAVAGTLNVTGNTTLNAATTTNLLVTASSTFQDFTSRNATSSLLYTNAFRGAGLAGCDASGDKLLWNSLTGQFSCGVDAGGAGSGITSLGAPGQLQTGATQTFASSSDANIGITITSAGNQHTFAMNWLGSLSVARGGTGWGNIESGTLLTGNGTGALATTSIGSSLQLASATLGLNLANTNIWSGLQRFGAGASTTALSANDFVAVGRTATTTIRGEANATSTFAGGIEGRALNITNGTSTFANGINITSGCYAVNGTCLTDEGVTGVTVSTFSSSGTWTKADYTGLSFTQVITSGGGGGGGGADGTDTTNETIGGGGGAGGTAIEMIAAGALGVTETVTVGTGGAAGLNTGGNGGTGNTSSFGAFNSATGGTGGVGSAANATGCAADNGAGEGGVGGTATGGDINLTGGAGHTGICLAELTNGGTGGASYWGGGGRGGVDGTGASAGSVGAAYGSGGGGAADEDQTVGAAGGAGANGVVVTMNYTSSGGDLAEWYETEEGVEAGDVVAIGADAYEYDSKLGLQKSTILAKATGGSSVVGVVSSAPYETIGMDILAKSARPRPIALAGRVPVKLSLENGEVKAGDLLAVSSEAGKAMRSTKAGVTVGRALDDMRCKEEGDECTVLILVNTTYSTGALLNVAMRDSGIEMNGIPGDLDLGRILLAEMLQERTQIASSTAFSDVFADRVVAGLEIIAPRVVAETLVVEGIEPVDEDIRLRIVEGGSFMIERVAHDALSFTFASSSDEVVHPLAVSIDAFGNALIAGSLDAASVTIGSREQPGGLTMHDTITGDPFCIRIVRGSLETTPDACDTYGDIPSEYASEPEESTVPDMPSPPPYTEEGSESPSVEDSDSPTETESAPETPESENEIVTSLSDEGVVVEEAPPPSEPPPAEAPVEPPPSETL